MGKMYVVVEASWEYDDEYYSESGSRYGDEHVGKAKKVFTKRTDAVVMAQKCNVKEIKGTNLAGYTGGDSLDSIIQDGKYEKLAELLTGDPSQELDYDNAEVPSDISDTKAAEILDCITIGWYDVVEVDAE
jgi:hypothetical protein